MYAICGATGNIGRVITEKLIEQGKKARAIGRSRERLQPLVNLGAEPFVADLGNSVALAKAFEGCEAVFVMIPPNLEAPDYRLYQNEVGQSMADAVKAAGIKYVVNLSSVGAHLSDGNGVVAGLHDQEQRLNALEDVNVMHVRPTFFFENHMTQIGTIKTMGVMATPQPINRPVPQIATRDVAEFAAERLMKLDFKGKNSRELLGPSDTSMIQVAQAIGHAIGKNDLEYVQISYDDARKYYVQAGISESAADGLIELEKAFADGLVTPTEVRSAANTTRTSLDSFAGMFAQAYRA